MSRDDVMFNRLVGELDDFFNDFVNHKQTIVGDVLKLMKTICGVMRSLPEDVDRHGQTNVPTFLTTMFGLV